MSANLENLAVATGLEKVSFHSNSKEGQCQRMFKDCTVELISHASKVMPQILETKKKKKKTKNKKKPTRCISWL